MGVTVSAGRTAGMDLSRSLEATTLAKVQAACNFVNAEIARQRHQSIGIAVSCGIGAIAFSSFIGVGGAIVPLVLAAGISVFFVNRARTELASHTKGIAAKRIVGGLSKELTYNPSSSLTRRHFAALDLFSEPCEHWQSSDEVGARAPGARYSLHRVRASGSQRKAVVFEGVILKIDFDESFPAHTIIVPDRHGQLLIASNGGVASGRKKDLVMMKNPAFEQMFSVYSTDYYEARKLITPFFMRIVTEARARLGTEMRLCFLQKSLYVTVAGDALRFKPTLFAPPLTPQAAVGMLVHLVSLAQHLAQTQTQE